ncbi:magnesium chelatase domain-containing protein [Streptomyces parvus]|uniref:magnesium chelatase domain-containing protein n=1 Tax=Streptomyces parvus TaxID=66428 RepID=UPI0033BC5D06
MSTEPTTGHTEFIVAGHDAGSAFTLWDVWPAPTDPARRAIMLEEAGSDAFDAFGELFTTYGATAQEAVHGVLRDLRERAGLDHYALSGSREWGPTLTSELYGGAGVAAATKDAAFGVAASSLPGVPSFHLRGLPDRCAASTRDRVRAGVINSGRRWPMASVWAEVTPLEPAGKDVSVAGASALDLALACSVLVAAGQIPCGCWPDVALIGELGLDGAVRTPKGLAEAVQGAAAQGARAVLVPADAVNDVDLAGVRVIGVASLHEALELLSDERHPLRMTAAAAHTPGSGLPARD